MPAATFTSPFSKRPPVNASLQSGRCAEAGQMARVQKLTDMCPLGTSRTDGQKFVRRTWVPWCDGAEVLEGEV